MITSVFYPSLSHVNTATTPCFLTSEEVLKNRIACMKNFFNGARVHFAIKANYNPEIIKILRQNGLDGIDAVSVNEVKYAKYLRFQSEQIIFTPNNIDEEEMKAAVQEGVFMNIGSWNELEMFAKFDLQRKVGIRLNPLFGAGENDFVTTAGEDVKFGFHPRDIEKLIEFSKNNNFDITCLHFHLGSGIYESNILESLFKFILSIIHLFPKIEKIDLGGGLGVRYDITKKPIDLRLFQMIYDKYTSEINSLTSKNIQFIFEPGKFLVAESTALVTKVTNIRDLGYKLIIGVNSGMNHNIRPPLYGANHGIINLSSNNELINCDVYGNICESSDFFGKNISLSMPEIGDYIAILSCGAYCSSMSSLYNLREYANEYLITSNGSLKLTRDCKDLNFNNLGYLL